MNPGLIIGIVAVLFFLTKKSTTTATTTVTTDQKRSQINYWISTYPASYDLERSIDIIDSISPGEIDNIYDYIFNYINKGTKPATGPLLTAIQIIKTRYDILTYIN